MSTKPLHTENDAIQQELELVQRLSAIGMALSAEKDTDALLERIMLEAKSITHADGGTLYKLNGDQLEFVILRNDTLNILSGGTSGRKPVLPPLNLYSPETGEPNDSTQAVCCVLRKQLIHIPDTYAPPNDDFNFRGTREFDKYNKYRTTSVLSVPMVNHKNEALGCLQLINAKDPKTGESIPFSPYMQQVVHSLASQAAIILDNKSLIEAQKKLLEAFIEVISKAIDRKSPYTGEHCQRLPAIMNMLTNAACEATEGYFKDFAFTDEQKYEVHIAAWLHDCGKITTPVHVMDKATKLEAITDRIDLIRTRFEVRKRDAKIAMLEAMSKPGADAVAVQKHYDDAIAALQSDIEFIAKTNFGGEFMTDDQLARLQRISEETWEQDGKQSPALTENELYNLSIRRGTINNEERTIMNDHMVVTAEMLEALPFPKHLQNVPEYALGHHERMDGKGYPRGIKAGTMSIPARMMAVADVFEALTASDRPYKPAKKLSETMEILGQMKKTNHLDPDMVDFMITSGVYKKYAEEYLAPHLIDEVDEARLLAIRPLPM